MQRATQSIATVSSTLSGLYNAINLFEANLPTSFVKAFLAVAKDPGRTVSDYANMCGVSNGANVAPAQ